GGDAGAAGAHPLGEGALGDELHVELPVDVLLHEVLVLADVAGEDLVDLAVLQQDPQSLAVHAEVVRGDGETADPAVAHDLDEIAGDAAQAESPDRDRHPVAQRLAELGGDVVRDLGHRCPSCQSVRPVPGRRRCRRRGGSAPSLCVGGDVCHGTGAERPVEGDPGPAARDRAPGRREPGVPPPGAGRPATGSRGPGTVPGLRRRPGCERMGGRVPRRSRRRIVRRRSGRHGAAVDSGPRRRADMQTIDLLVIAAYLVATAWLGLKLSGRQTGLKDYFLGGRDLPWWAVCLSVVATETSALTVIGIPVMSYLGNLSYLQLGLGYILGRVVVAFFMLPRYYDGEMITAYAYLGKRFGTSTQTTAGVTFLITRLLADGIR